MLKNMFKIEINVRNEIPMAELVKIDLLFVGRLFAVFSGLSPQYREGHRSSFLKSPYKVTKTTKKLSFHENGHGIQKKWHNYMWKMETYC